MTVPIAQLASVLRGANRIAPEPHIGFSSSPTSATATYIPRPLPRPLPRSRASREEARTVLFSAADSLVQLALTLGGNPTGERAVGTLKRDGST